MSRYRIYQFTCTREQPCTGKQQMHVYTINKYMSWIPKGMWDDNKIGQSKWNIVTETNTPHTVQYFHHYNFQNGHLVRTIKTQNKTWVFVFNILLTNQIYPIPNLLCLPNTCTKQFPFHAGILAILFFAVHMWLCACELNSYEQCYQLSCIALHCGWDWFLCLFP